MFSFHVTGPITISTPPVLAKTCQHYVPECIGHTQKVLFYMGMSLIAVGIAGNLVSVKTYLADQKAKKPEDNKDEGDENILRCTQLDPLRLIPGLVMVVVVPIVGAIALLCIKPWKLWFGIPATCTVFATVIFPTGCLATGWSGQRGARWLHKAAIILPGDLSEDKQVTNKWRQVEEAKIAVRMVLMWMTFVVCGMVSSTGNTYFVDQAKDMNRKLGTLKFTPQILLLAQRSANKVFG